MFVNVLVSVLPRKLSVSVPLAKKVCGPASPGAIVQSRSAPPTTDGGGKSAAGSRRESLSLFRQKATALLAIDRGRGL